MKTAAIKLTTAFFALPPRVDDMKLSGPCLNVKKLDIYDSFYVYDIWE